MEFPGLSRFYSSLKLSWSRSLTYQAVSWWGSVSKKRTNFLYFHPSSSKRKSIKWLWLWMRKEGRWWAKCQDVPLDKRYYEWVQPGIFRTGVLSEWWKWCTKNKLDRRRSEPSEINSKMFSLELTLPDTFHGGSEMSERDLIGECATVVIAERLSWHKNDQKGAHKK